MTQYGFLPNRFPLQILVSIRHPEPQSGLGRSSGQVDRRVGPGFDKRNGDRAAGMRSQGKAALCEAGQSGTPELASGPSVSRMGLLEMARWRKASSDHAGHPKTKMKGQKETINNVDKPLSV